MRAGQPAGRVNGQMQLEPEKEAHEVLAKSHASAIQGPVMVSPDGVADG